MKFQEISKNLFCLCFYLHISYQTHRICMLDYGEFVPTALNESVDTTYRKLGRKVRLESIDLTLRHSGQEKCMDKVMTSEHYAHIDTASYIKFLYGSSDWMRESTYFLKEKIYEGNLAFLYKKHTPWKGKIDDKIRQLLESGIPLKWYKDIMTSLTFEGKGSVSYLYNLVLSTSNDVIKKLCFVHIQYMEFLRGEFQRKR